MEEVYHIVQKLKENREPDSIILEATVPTGLETEAIREIVIKLIAPDNQVGHVPGRVYFNSDLDSFEKVKRLRSIDNVNLVVDVLRDLNFIGNSEFDLGELVSLVDTVNLIPFVRNWAEITNFRGVIEPTKEQHDTARIKQDKIHSARLKNMSIDLRDEQYKHNILKYRVTCERVGTHTFTSNNGAYKFGGEVNNKYQWIVALSDWDLNIFLRINHEDAMILLKVTVRSLHRRSLVSFGPTSLRPTIAYGLLSMARLDPGDHLVDPLCGSGSIPIECMYAFPGVIISCGDINYRATSRTCSNIELQNTNMSRPTLFKWNATHMPFKNNSIDAIVTDLPFGKRSGNRRDNSTLYRKLMSEFARVLKLKTGRIVILTKDCTNLYRAMDYKKPNSLWNIANISMINVGALKCIAIVAKLNV